MSARTLDAKRARRRRRQARVPLHVSAMRKADLMLKGQNNWEAATGLRFPLNLGERTMRPGR